MAILLEGYVDPVVSARWSRFLPYQLMEPNVVHKPEEPTLAGGFTGDEDVVRFACHVLTGGGSSYDFVEFSEMPLFLQTWRGTKDCLR